VVYRYDFQFMGAEARHACSAMNHHHLRDEGICFPRDFHFERKIINPDVAGLVAGCGDKQRQEEKIIILLLLAAPDPTASSI
jgi:hypothetical protein